MKLMAFWCKVCKTDQDLLPMKNGNSFAQWYESPCEKCHQKLIRHTTPQTDPYYYHSKRVKIQRGEMQKDLLQYGDAGFQTLYPKQWAEFEKQKEQLELKEKTKQQERKKLLDTNPGNRKILEKVFALEDK